MPKFLFQHPDPQVYVLLLLGDGDRYDTFDFFYLCLYFGVEEIALVRDARAGECVILAGGVALRY